MTAVTIVERKHAGHGAVFTLDGDESARFYIVTCCTASEVGSVNVERAEAVVTCPIHNSIIRRTYYPVLTDADRAAMNERVYGTFGFNPPTDPDGDSQQRARRNGYTTEAWHRARRLR